MTKQEVGRLALRHEGEWWNAYWTKHQDSMIEAVLLGSIRVTLAHSAAKDAFIEAMKLAFNNLVEDLTGQTPEWGAPHAAPESERSGHA